MCLQERDFFPSMFIFSKECELLLYENIKRSFFKVLFLFKFFFSYEWTFIFYMQC